MSHRQHWSSSVGSFFIVSTHFPLSALASSSHIGLMPDLYSQQYDTTASKSPTVVRPTSYATEYELSEGVMGA